MERERDFVSQRFQIVKARLEDPAAVIKRVDRIQLQREYRLLGKLLDEVNEGEILGALEAWRRYLGEQLSDYKRRIAPEMRRVHQEWFQLREDQKTCTEEPPHSLPGTTVTDKNGWVWVIDDRFLQMMDDEIERLKRWLSGD